jgi:ribosomal protein L37AE/L43A
MKGDRTDDKRADDKRADDKRTKSKKEAVSVELKYCEHCGGLWLRERGTGVVYCPGCQPKVADLPAPKRKPERVKMPVRPHALVEDYGIDLGDEDDMEFEAAGGAA